mgnify:FL=1
MPKCQNSNATFWVIFKQCDAGCSKKSWPNSNMYLFLAVDGNFSTANRLCHCLAIPKGKWFSMLITSRKNENVAVVTSFMTSTIQQKFHSAPRLAFWIVASTCCCSKNLEVVNESTFSPITLRMRSSCLITWQKIFKSGCWSRTVQNYTRWALIDLESFCHVLKL